MKQFYKIFPGRIRKRNFLRNSVLRFAFLLAGYSNIDAQVSTYSFAQSSGTFTSITGTVLGTATGNTSATNLNSNVYPLALPFNFEYNGSLYNSLNVSTNGFITFGATAPSSTLTSPLSSTAAYEGAVSVFGRNISSFFDINGVSGDISWETIGTAPNREVVIQWKNFRPNSITSTTSVYAFSFQLRLRETSNVISMIYDSGSYLAGTTTVSGTAQIGLRGSTNTDFNNRINGTTLEFVNSTEGTANNSGQAFNTTNAVPGMPISGLTYTWTPPSCYVPSGLSAGTATTNTVDIQWTASSSSPSGYDIYYSTSNTPPNSSTPPSISGVSGTSATLSLLAASTTYYVWIRSNCGGGNTSVWSLQPVPVTTSCQPPAILSATGATVCPGQAATLSATADAGVTLTWYDAQTGGNIVGTGNSYTTPALAATTDYWVTASTGIGGVSVGKSTYSPSPSSGIGTTNFGLVFDVLSTFVLESVTIYPVSASGASGSVIIDVIDGSGNILNTATVNVTGSPTSDPVPQVVNLGFTLFPGTNYKLRPRSFTGISGLLFDPSANAPGGNYGYPFALANIVTINTSTLSVSPTNTPRNDLYYYFYDWKVSTKCESARQSVTAVVDTNCLSTSEANAKEVVKISPNPFSEVININKPKLIKSIRVTDVSGKLIRTIVQPESVLTLNDLSQGLYLLILDMKNGSQQSIKIIKK